MPLLVGTSGWQYRDWRGAFYPERLPVSQWLEYYATRFPTVENNGTFYRLPVADTFASWRARTPAGFVMAVKASRYLTHIRRLREPAEPVGRLWARPRSSVTGSGRCSSSCRRPCGPTRPRWTSACVSSPRSSPAWPERAQAARAAARLRRVPARVLADAGGQAILAAHDAALCWSDRRGRPLGPLWRTADWGYVRFHEGAAQPWPRYGPQALRTWLSRIAEAFPPEADVFAYFNNDQHAAAPADADALVEARRPGRLAGPAAAPGPTG